MAPEQFGDSAWTDGPTCTLWGPRLRGAGRYPPVSGPTATGVSDAALAGRTAAARGLRPELPAALCAAVLRALAKNPPTASRPPRICAPRSRRLRRHSSRQWFGGRRRNAVRNRGAGATRASGCGRRTAQRICDPVAAGPPSPAPIPPSDAPVGAAPARGASAVPAGCSGLAEAPQCSLSAPTRSFSSAISRRRSVSVATAAPTPSSWPPADHVIATSPPTSQPAPTPRVVATQPPVPTRAPVLQPTPRPTPRPAATPTPPESLTQLANELTDWGVPPQKVLQSQVGSRTR